jgi:hypothetical protein
MTAELPLATRWRGRRSDADHGNAIGQLSESLFKLPRMYSG